jgi:hypothetical protein
MKRFLSILALLLSVSLVSYSADLSKNNNDKEKEMSRSTAQNVETSTLPIDFLCGSIPVYVNGSLVGFTHLYCNAYGNVVRSDFEPIP